MALTDQAIRSVRPREKPVKLFDSGGLFLLATPGGGRWWRLKYRYGGKERGISLGVYPAVSLKKARQRRDEARELLADGIDPSAQRRSTKAAQAHTFDALANEYLELLTKKFAPGTLEKQKWLLRAFLSPEIGAQPIAQISSEAVLSALRKIEANGHHETTHRTKQLAGRIFRYAVATGRANHDPTGALRGALAPIITRNRAAITEPLRIGELLRAIDAYQGQPATFYALKLAPFLFVRPGELRAAQWSEFDLESAEWRIPAERMKMGERHIVPLPRQAVELLQELQAHTGFSRYLFPSLRDHRRPMSDNTVNAALRRLGYTSEEMTGHGFRAMASTCLNEQGFPPDVIELQLAHAERNKVRAAYNRAERLPERRKMMQVWADYLDGLKAGDKAPEARAK